MRGKDAGSGNSRAISATEDAASRRSSVFRRPSVKWGASSKSRFNACPPSRPNRVGGRVGSRHRAHALAEPAKGEVGERQRNREERADDGARDRAADPVAKERSEEREDR